jgi:hypothetical protein
MQSSLPCFRKLGFYFMSEANGSTQEDFDCGNCGNKAGCDRTLDSHIGYQDEQSRELFQELLELGEEYKYDAAGNIIEDLDSANATPMNENGSSPNEEEDQIDPPPFKDGAFKDDPEIIPEPDKETNEHDLAYLDELVKAENDERDSLLELDAANDVPADVDTEHFRFKWALTNEGEDAGFLLDRNGQFDLAIQQDGQWVWMSDLLRANEGVDGSASAKESGQEAEEGVSQKKYLAAEQDIEALQSALAELNETGRGVMVGRDEEGNAKTIIIFSMQPDGRILSAMYALEEKTAQDDDYEEDQDNQSQESVIATSQPNELNGEIIASGTEPTKQGPQIDDEYRVRSQEEHLLNSKDNEFKIEKILFPKAFSKETSERNEVVFQPKVLETRTFSVAQSNTLERAQDSKSVSETVVNDEELAAQVKSYKMEIDRVARETGISLIFETEEDTHEEISIAQESSVTLGQKEGTLRSTNEVTPQETIVRNVRDIDPSLAETTTIINTTQSRNIESRVTTTSEEGKTQETAGVLREPTKLVTEHEQVIHEQVIYIEEPPFEAKDDVLEVLEIIDDVIEPRADIKLPAILEQRISGDERLSPDPEAAIEDQEEANVEMAPALERILNLENTQGSTQPMRIVEIPKNQSTPTIENQPRSSNIPEQTRRTLELIRGLREIRTSSGQGSPVITKADSQTQKTPEIKLPPSTASRYPNRQAAQRRIAA